MKTMKDGAYLLVLPGQDYGMTVILGSQTNPDGTIFQIVAGVEGVRLVSDLPEGYQLFPMLVITPARASALIYATKVMAEVNKPSDKSDGANHMRTLVALILDLKDAMP
jgi:hypothetical protein